LVYLICYTLIIVMFFDVAESLSNFNTRLTKKIIPSPFVALIHIYMYYIVYSIYFSYKKGNTQYPYHFFLSEKIFSYTEIIVKSGLRRHYCNRRLQRTFRLSMMNIPTNIEIQNKSNLSKLFRVIITLYCSTNNEFLTN